MKIKLFLCLTLCLNVFCQKKIIGIQLGLSSLSLEPSIAKVPVFYTKSLGFSFGYSKELSNKKFLKNKIGAYFVYNPVLEKFQSVNKILESKIQIVQLKLYHQPIIFTVSQKKIKPFISLGYYAGLRLSSVITYRINGDKWIQDGNLYRASGFFNYSEKRPIDAGIKASIGLNAGKFPIEICSEKGFVKNFPGNYQSSLSLLFTL